MFGSGRPKIWPGSQKIDKKLNKSGIDSFSVVLSVANKLEGDRLSYFHKRKCFLTLPYHCYGLRPRRYNHSPARES
jgi:hypothetical protein